MNSMKIFQYNDSKEIRTVMMNGEPWWVLKDVCNVLDIKNPTDIAKKLDEDEQGKVDPRLNLGSRSNMPITIINESGLYSTILQSRKPEAKKFKRWITSEVLPSIRKHGAYMTDETLEKATSDPEFLGKLVMKLNDKVNTLQHEITENEPRVLLAKAIEDEDGSISIKELAKVLKQNGINIGGNRLFEWLRAHNYLCHKIGIDYNDPTQYSMQLGLFRIVKSEMELPNGQITIRKITRVTPKGQKYFVKKFLKLKKEMEFVA